MTTLFSWSEGTLPTVSGTVTSDGTVGSPSAPSLEISSTGGQSYASFTVSGTGVWASRFHFRTPTSWPGTGTIFASWMAVSFLAGMQLAPSAAAGAVRLIRPGGAQVVSSANGVLSTNTWYRGELHYDPANTRARIAVFAIGNNTALYDSGWQTNANFSNHPTSFRIGSLVNQTINFRADSIIGVDSVASFIGEAPADNPPVAVTTSSRRYVHPQSHTHLFGADSTDDVGISSYSWTQLSGETVSLTGASTHSASFYAPDVLGDLVFRLTVTDTLSQTDTSDITITVVPFGTVTIIGDSLTERETDTAAPPDREDETRAVLEDANWDPGDIYWYGKGGKRMLAADVLGRTTINDLSLADTALGGTLTQVVIALGTNDFLMSDTDFGDAIDDILDAADALDVQDLIWVNFAYKNPDNIAIPPKNAILDTKVSARSFARVADWKSFIHNPHDDDDWLTTSDDVHMTAQGYVKRDEFILDQLGGPGTPPPAWTLTVWNGTTEVPATMTVWNGTTEVPINSIELST